MYNRAGGVEGIRVCGQMVTVMVLVLGLRRCVRYDITQYNVFVDRNDTHSTILLQLDDLPCLSQSRGNVPTIISVCAALDGQKC